MNVTTARKAAKTPDEFSTRELHDALDFIVSDERFSERQVSTMQARIEEVLNSRKAVGGRTYPIGTNVHDVVCHDRSTKLVFGCKDHPAIQYMSKQPFSSNCFPANEHTKRAEFGIEDMECDHKFSADVWFTVAEYTNNERDF